MTSTAPRTTVADLPPEILCYILELASTASSQTDLEASLVCRQWREPGQRAAFARVELSLQRGKSSRDDRRIDRACHALIASPAFPRHPVRHLTINTGPKQVNEVAALLAACTGLQHLVLQPKYYEGGHPEDQLSNPDRLDSFVGGVLSWRMLAVPALRGGCSVRSIGALGLTFCAFEGLKSLQLYFPEQFAPPEPSLVLPFHLRELSLWMAPGRQQAGAPALTALLSASASSLDHFRIRLRSPGCRNFGTDVLAPAGPRVRRLTFILDAFPPILCPPPPVSPFSTYTNLETLEFVTGPDGPVRRFLDTLGSELWESLPTNAGLTRLVLSGCTVGGSIFLPLSAKHILEGLSTRAAAHIRRIDLPTLDRADVGGAFDAGEYEGLMQYCDEHSIHINYRQELLGAGELEMSCVTSCRLTSVVLRRIVRGGRAVSISRGGVLVSFPWKYLPTIGTRRSSPNPSKRPQHTLKSNTRFLTATFSALRNSISLDTLSRLAALHALQISFPSAIAHEREPAGQDRPCRGNLSTTAFLSGSLADVVAHVGQPLPANRRHHPPKSRQHRMASSASGRSVLTVRSARAPAPLACIRPYLR